MGRSMFTQSVSVLDDGPHGDMCISSRRGVAQYFFEIGEATVTFNDYMER